TAPRLKSCVPLGVALPTDEFQNETPVNKIHREGHEFHSCRFKLSRHAASNPCGLLLKPGRLISPPGTYFVAFSARLFVVESYVRLFLKTLYGYRRYGRYELNAFILMPEHVHL